MGTHHSPCENLALLDLSEPDITPLNLVETGHAAAVIAAGMPKIAECEQDKARSRLVNVEGTLNLARQLSEAGLTVIYLSSDYVFDGRKGGYQDGDPTHPVTEYGAQKAEVERRLEEATGGNHLILRLGKIIGLEKGDGTLLDEMASRLTKGETLRAARDQIMSPMLDSDLIAAFFALQNRGERGLFNVCGRDSRSRAAMAQDLARRLGVASERVSEILIADLHESFPRPLDTSMKTVRLDQAVSVPQMSLEECLERVAANYLSAKA